MLEEGARAREHHGEPGWDSERLLAAREDDVEPPGFLAQLLATDGADPVDDREHAVGSRDGGECLERDAHAGRGVDVGQRHGREAARGRWAAALDGVAGGGAA